MLVPVVAANGEKHWTRCENRCLSLDDRLDEGRKLHWREHGGLLDAIYYAVAGISKNVFCVASEKMHCNNKIVLLCLSGLLCWFG